MADTVDVLIVSRLATVRAGLRVLLAGAERLRVIGETASLDGGLGAELVPDVGVVLLDAASLDEVDETVAMLEGGGSGLVVLGPPGVGRRLALAAPSFGWAALARDADPERIEPAVHAVSAGLVVVEPEQAVEALGRRATDPAGPLGPLPGPDDLDELTGREREVLTLVATGLTNKAIAQRLVISDHTVKFHVASILAKLGAESRTEAVHLAARRGLLAL